MLSEQSGVGNEVFEGLNLSGDVGSKRTCSNPRLEYICENSTETDLAFVDTTPITNLDLLPPSPIVPQSLTTTTPRKQIHDFAVLQADYTLSRNANVSLDQRGQAIGLVKQRLGA